MSALAAESAQPANKSPVELLTGEVWQQSQPDNKRAWLFGIDTAVDIEKAVNEKMQSQGKRAKSLPLSPFVTTWMAAFDNMNRNDIIEAVDQWYTAHPDQLSRPVMDTIWYEIIVPRIDQK